MAGFPRRFRPVKDDLWICDLPEKETSIKCKGLTKAKLSRTQSTMRNR